ncbi:MAG: hypothetical protein R3B48_02285 [Kofleriaceae bacterium]
MPSAAVEIGDQVFLQEDGEAFGAVRDVHSHDLVVYVEGSGDFLVPAVAVTAVHDGKIVVDPTQLAAPMVAAIELAHQREEPGL